MLVANKDFLFEEDGGNMFCTKAKIYGFDKDGNVKEYGDAVSGGTANPLAVGDGCLYIGNHRELTRMYIDREKSELITEGERDFAELEGTNEVIFNEVNK